jgi:hypothetical protein
MSGTEQAAGAGVSMIEFSDAGASQYGLCFFDLDEAGRIVRITDFWPDPYEPPAGRAHLAGRIWPAGTEPPVPAGTDEPRGQCRRSGAGPGGVTWPA